MNVVFSNFRHMFLDFVLYTCFYFIVRFSMLYQLHVKTFDSINLIKDLMLHCYLRFFFLGLGVYHSTEVFCDYVPDKLYQLQG